MMLRDWGRSGWSRMEDSRGMISFRERERKREIKERVRERNQPGGDNIYITQSCSRFQCELNLTFSWIASIRMSICSSALLLSWRW